MNMWNDLFLTLPMPEEWLRVLLFAGFGLHLLFVLLMLGTAMIGLFSFIQSGLEKSGQLWNRGVVGTHTALKSLAVVLGVAPLLVIQVYYSDAFFTATGIFAYAWIAIIPLLIAGFLLIDLFGHKLARWPLTSFVAGVLGVAALLTVPAIFSGAMSLMERPDRWAEAALKSPFGSVDMLLHWGARYLHVLGAAVVFGGVFHLYFSARGDADRTARLQRWVFAGLLFQVVVGTALLGTLNGPLGQAVIMALALGVTAAMIAAWLLRPVPVTAAEGRRFAGQRTFVVLLPVLFVSMIGARQLLQDQALAPQRQAELAARTERATVLARYDKDAQAQYADKLNTVYDNGATIYDHSCQPCHGGMGEGDGAAGARLLVRAENLTALRVDRDYLHQILVGGVPGSAMPYFTFFDRAKLESLMDELQLRCAILDAPAAPAGQPDAAARQVWNTTCAECHAKDGSISDFGHTLHPTPPNLTRYSLTGTRALEIITDGYAGTVMQPYRALPDAVRQGLVDITLELRKG